MTAPLCSRGRGRGGKGLLPPNPLQWEAEHSALDLREELSIGFEERLSVSRALAGQPGVRIWAISELPLAQCFIDHLRGAGSREWSGAAIPVRDEVWIVYNDAHPRTRIRATLMEELFHLRLGHPPSLLRVYVDTGSRRTYDASIENAAYSSGAAALVPYIGLRSALERNQSVASIAEDLNVSTALVEYRLKVTKLWGRRVRRMRKAG